MRKDLLTLIYGVTICSMLFVGTELRAAAQDLKSTKDQPEAVVELPVPTPDEPAAITVSKPYRFLLIGDSMMAQGFGPVLENALLEYADVTVHREGRYSTGLNRRDYFNWDEYAAELIDQYSPNVLIVNFGGNDGQGITREDGTAVQYGRDGWYEAYADRVSDFMAYVSARVDLVIWMENPIARDVSFQNKLKLINQIHTETAARFSNIVIVKTWDRFTIDGAYAPYVADNGGLVQRVKTDDGIHVTTHGGRIMTDLVLQTLGDHLDLRPTI